MSESRCVNVTDADRAVVLAYAENNMNVAETARELNMHYNTVRYHLDKVTEATGLNPHWFYDLIALVQECEKKAENS